MHPWLEESPQQPLVGSCPFSYPAQRGVCATGIKTVVLLSEGALMQGPVIGRRSSASLRTDLPGKQHDSTLRGLSSWAPFASFFHRVPRCKQ